MTEASKLRGVVLAKLKSGNHTEAFADGARWAVQEAEKLDRYDIPVAAEPRRRGFVTGYLMDGRTIDLIRESASRCANPEPHEVHWPDLKVGEGDPMVTVAGTYVCPGVPPAERQGSGRSLDPQRTPVSTSEHDSRSTQGA
jgi:hypothetical protein